MRNGLLRYSKQVECNLFWGIPSFLIQGYNLITGTLADMKILQ